MATLEERITRLERALASGGRSEVFQPNYLSINAAGQVVANFPGGVSISEVTSGPPTFNDAIIFTPAHGSGGNVIPGGSGGLSQDYSVTGNVHDVELISNPDAHDQATIDLIASESGGSGVNSVVVSAEDAANLILFAKHILNSDGTSDFAQVAKNLSDLASIASARSNLGFGTANPLRWSSVGGISLVFSASVTGSVVVNHGLKDANGNNLTPQACYPSLAFGTPAVVTGITYDPASMTSTQVTVYGVRPAAASITLPITVLSVA